jgi:hypothetical protein
MPLFERAVREVAMKRSSSILASAMGVGLGVGLGLASVRFSAMGSGEGSTSTRGPTPADVEAELRQLVVDGRDTGVSFANFPYYLRYVWGLVQHKSQLGKGNLFTPSFDSEMHTRFDWFSVLLE